MRIGGFCPFCQDVSKAPFEYSLEKEMIYKVDKRSRRPEAMMLIAIILILVLLLALLVSQELHELILLLLFRVQELHSD